MNNVRASSRILSLIGLIFALGVGFPLTHWGELYVRAGDLWTAELMWWVAVLVLLDYVLAAERRPLSSIGLRRPRGWDLGWGAIFGVVLLAGAGVIDSVLLPALHMQINLSTYQAIMGAPLGYRIALVTRAAVCEEILFRGYSIGRLKEWTGSIRLAGLISVVVFTLMHLSAWGAPQLIVAGYGGVLLTVLYVWRRNTWGNFVAHWIGDCGFILAPLLLAHHH